MFGQSPFSRQLLLKLCFLENFMVKFTQDIINGKINTYHMVALSATNHPWFLLNIYIDA
jgi:hypothetical protein